MQTRRCYGCMKETTQAICGHCGYDSTRGNDLHQLPAGTVLQDRYLIGKALGQGGFGITYLGWDNFLDIKVAIKEYFPNGLVVRENTYANTVSVITGYSDKLFTKSRERFFREAKTLAKFSNEPGIVHVLNLFLDNNTAYIVMEYVEGVTLKDHIDSRGGHVSAKETFDLLRPILEALEKVHEAGIVHRDISPDNIMLLPNGGVKLLDFGAVRAVENADVDRPLSRATETILKQGFAPIEQYQSQGCLGPWTDVYALCATVHYCLTGRVPPNAPRRIMREADVNWDNVPGLTAHQAQVLAKGMALAPKDRIRSVRELRSSLYVQQEVISQTMPVIRPAPQVRAEPRQTGDWRSNVLMSVQFSDATKVKPEEFMTIPVFGSSIPREAVRRVTFLDSTASAPADCWDVSAEKNWSVLAWAKREGELYHLYIAGNGGINGKLACRELFFCYRKLETIEFNGCFHTDEATDMKFMFDACTDLRSIDLTGFNTSNVTNMSSMFSSCRVKSLDLRSFDTSKVRDMHGMFYNCADLTDLDLSSFNTASVTDMSVMFAGCRIRNIQIGHFDTSKVVNHAAFALSAVLVNGCPWKTWFEQKATEPVIRPAPQVRAEPRQTGDWRSNVLMSVAIPNKWGQKIEAIEKMGVFGSDIPRSSVSSVTFLDSMLVAPEDCWDVSAQKNRSVVAWVTWEGNNCRLYIAADGGINGKLACRELFYGYTGLESVAFYNCFHTEEAVDMESMFGLCFKLRSVDLSGFRTGNVTNMCGMFLSCRALRYPDLRSFDTSKVTSMASMFFGCVLMKELDLSSFDTSSVCNMYQMFYNSGVQEVKIGNFNTSKVTRKDNFVYGSLWINGRPWETWFNG